MKTTRHHTKRAGAATVALLLALVLGFASGSVTPSAYRPGTHAQEATR